MKFENRKTIEKNNQIPVGFVEKKEKKLTNP